MDLPSTYREDMTESELAEAFAADGEAPDNARALAAVAFGDVPEGLPVI